MGSPAPLPDGRLTVSLSTRPSWSLTITKTPSRVSSSTSSSSRSSPDRMLLAAFRARALAVTSTFENRASLSKKKRATPSTRRIAPIARAVNSVRRHRIGKFSSPPQRVTSPSHRADQALLSGGVHLPPQVADVDVNEVGRQAELLVPDAREEEIPGEHPPGILGHELEQFVFAGCKLYLPVGPSHPSGRGVDLEVGNTEYLVSLGPPEQRPDAGEQLLYVERFGQVIVGATVEAVYLVEGGVAGRQHDNGHPATSLAQLPEDTDPVQTRQHNVEDDQRRPERLRFLDAGETVVGAPHRKAEVLELGLNETGDR